MSGDADPDRMGCSQSFQRFQRNDHFEDCLRARHRFLSIFPGIVMQLPKLRAIRFTDYRGLAKDLESYSELCTRLFGNVLEPQKWNWHIEGSKQCTTEAIFALNTIPDLTRGLRSVSFGPHGYEMFHYSDEPLVTYKEPHYLSIKRYEIPFEDWTVSSYRDPISYDWKQIFGNLRSARLPFLILAPDQSLNVAKAVMDALPDTIISLAISTRGPVEAFLAQQCMTSLMIRPFDELVFPYRFPHLQTLELEGWCVELTALQDLLRAQASTLRRVHVINLQCSANERPGEEQDLATFSAFVAKELHLTGIKIIEVDLYGPVEVPNKAYSRGK